MSDRERPLGPLELVDTLAAARRSTSTLMTAMERIDALCDEDSDEQKAEREYVRELVARGIMRLDGDLVEAELLFIIGAIKQAAEAALAEVTAPLRCEAFATIGEPCSAEATVWVPNDAYSSGPERFCERHGPPDAP